MGDAVRSVLVKVITIRALISIAVCLLVAFLAWAGSITAFWSIQTVEQDVAPRRSELSIPKDTIPDLAPRLRPRLKAVDAAGPSPERQRAPCRVKIEGKNPQTALYVAIIDGESGAWIGGQAVNAPLPHTLTFDSIPIGRHDVRIARDKHRARSGYLARADVEVTVAREPGGVTILCATRSLRVKLARSPQDAKSNSIESIPVILRRQDDSKWRYQTVPSSVALTDAQGQVTFVDLGAGTYVLSMQGFDPDAGELKRLVFRLDEFDQDTPVLGRPR